MCGKRTGWSQSRSVLWLYFLSPALHPFPIQLYDCSVSAPSSVASQKLRPAFKPSLSTSYVSSIRTSSPFSCRCVHTCHGRVNGTSRIENVAHGARKKISVIVRSVAISIRIRVYERVSRSIVFHYQPWRTKFAMSTNWGKRNEVWQLNNIVAVTDIYFNQQIESMQQNQMFVGTKRTIRWAQTFCWSNKMFVNQLISFVGQ